MPKQIPLAIAEPLILAIEKRETIYNTRSPHYKNRIMTELAWKEVSDEVRCDVPFCKTTWATLRGTYTRILAQMKVLTRSGSAWKSPKWYLFSQMSFLKEYVAHGDITDYLDRIACKSTQQQIQEVPVQADEVAKEENSCQDSLDLEVEEEAQEQEHKYIIETVEDYEVSQTADRLVTDTTADFSSASDIETNDTDPLTSTSTSTGGSARMLTPRQRIKKRKSGESECDPLQKAIIDLIDKKRKTIDLENEDPIFMYLKSLVPFINKLTDTNKHKFMAQTTTNLMDMIVSQDPQ